MQVAWKSLKNRRFLRFSMTRHGAFSSAWTTVRTRLLRAKCAKDRYPDGQGRTLDAPAR